VADYQGVTRERGRLARKSLILNKLARPAFFAGSGFYRLLVPCAKDLLAGFPTQENYGSAVH